MSDNEEQSDENSSNYLFDDSDFIEKNAESSPLDNSEKSSNANVFPFTQRLQPYPFSFISALRRKLELEAQHEVQNVNKNKLEKAELNEKMDFIKPLKIPDSKITPKVDYSPRELRNASPSRLRDESMEKSSKSSERVNRKLDFLSSQSSVDEKLKVSEKLKAPEINFSSLQSFSSFTKKKEVRDSRDKSKKRIKKDESPNDDGKKWKLSKALDKSKSCERLKKDKKALPIKDDKKRPKAPREDRKHFDYVTVRNDYQSNGRLDDKYRHEKLPKAPVYKKLGKKAQIHQRLSSDHDELPSDSVYSEAPPWSNEKLTSDIDKNHDTDEAFLDSKKISFREDSYSQQEEFANLVTPDLSLVYKPKRKKDQRTMKSFDDQKLSTNNKDVPLLHPTALHMQFQAELHLFDTYNESIRQVMDVENTLYNVKQDQAREKLKLIESQIKLPSDGILPDGKEEDPDEELKGQKEVQTQTANDIATQTELISRNSGVDLRMKHPGITYSRGSDLDSIDLEGLDQLNDIPLPNKMRAMSEISLHETTSSIKTETGTEISISTRDVTYSFNKFLDHEMAQLIKDEKQTYDKIEMLFRSHEKTLHDRTRKLVKLEEQKRALRDTGQDSQISSVKKKQRALLLKLQQEKDEINRLKELHKKASQERKLMLQKQRNMLNPEMSTKSFLTKLKRSADCQSPRRLSGPMKGYDIRSNSSISSLIDSDKSQIERSNIDEKLELSDDKPLRASSYPLEESSNSSRLESPTKYQLKARKFEEKMPKIDLLRLKAHHMELESKLQARSKASASDSPIKSESDTLVEELSKKSKRERSDDKKGEKVDKKVHEIKVLKRKPAKTKPKTPANILNENILKSKFNTNIEELKSKRSKVDKTERIDKVGIERDFSPTEDSYQSILEEINLNESANSLQALVKHSKAVKEKNYKLLRDIAHEHDAKENISYGVIEKDGQDSSSGNNIKIKDNGDVQNAGNISTRSQFSTFTISRHSSGDSEKSYSRSVVIRSQQEHPFKTSKKLEQILHAREAALATRRNCVEDWIAWHAKLKAEESQIIRMEEAALKLVSASSSALSCNDSTMSTDLSEVEDRVDLLMERIAERRTEMTKLKKEVRRHAKQRLKTLEANLLNQIKKYDITISEMRKKLEQKRNCIKESGKLAIEAKSIADVKVPEIPIKRIQDLYKSHDLLRSRSESDLIVKNIYSLSKDNNKDVDYQSTHSLTTKITSKSDEKGKTTSRSIESILEEAQRTLSSQSSRLSISKNDNKSISERKLIEKLALKSKSVDKTDNSLVIMEISKRSTEIGNKSSEIGDKSIEICKEETKSEATPLYDSSTIIYPKIDINTEKSVSNIAEENITAQNNSLFSNKIDQLHLSNKNLTDDINTLENDLKTLSEMVSKFSKKLDHKSVDVSLNQATIVTEKSTAKEITENFSASEMIETLQSGSKVTDSDQQSIKTHEYEDQVRTPEYPSIKSDTDIPSIKTSDDRSVKLDTDIPSVETSESSIHIVKSSVGNKLSVKKSENDDWSVKSPRIDNLLIKSLRTDSRSTKSSISESEIQSEVLSAIIPSKNQSPEPKSSEEIDFQAKSKAILNVVEQSIISGNFELSGAALEKSMIDLHKDNEALSSDFNSLEGDIKSISKMISQITGNKQTSIDIDHSRLNLGKQNSVTSEITENLSVSQEIADEFGTVSDSLIASIDDDEGKGSEDRFTTEIAEKSASENHKLAFAEKSGDESLIEEYIESNVDESEHDSSYSSQKSDKSARDYRSSFDKSKDGDDDAENEVLSESKISHNWTLSESFEPISLVNASLTENQENEEEPKNDTAEIQVSLFIPKGESTNIQELYDINLEVSEEIATIDKFGKNAENVTDELDDILDIIERDSKQPETVYNSPCEVKLSREIGNNFVTEKHNDLNLTAEVEPVLQKLTEILVNVENNMDKKRRSKEAQNRICDHSSEIGDDSEDNGQFSHGLSTSMSEKIDSEDRHQDEKIAKNWQHSESPNLKNIEEIDNTTEFQQHKDEDDDAQQLIEEGKKSPTYDEKRYSKNLKSIFSIKEIVKDPDYEDISEESLEVSEILDRSKFQKSAKRNILEKYEAVQQTDEVLRILDEISAQSSLKKSLESKVETENKIIAENEDPKVAEILKSPEDSLSSEKIAENREPKIAESMESTKNSLISEKEDEENTGVVIEDLDESEHLEPEVPKIDLKLPKIDDNDKSVDKDEISSEISEDADADADTPRGVSDIDLDSPREQNDSRLDVDILDDDLLVENESDKCSNKKGLKGECQSGGISTTEKDIEMMIAKLRSSLDQPGLEVVEVDARLLRIEQLQIELEIKKLEAEEKSFYVREIPNKPPPPYTPPGIGSLSPESSPILSPSIVSTNVEELTAFTEKATIIIFNAKQLGKDIMALEAPSEIYEFNKDNNEVAKKDRKIYNTFLFDLCKETIAEVYQSEYEKPGPSWTKPNVKTKSAIKIPRTVDELNEYVSKEVATLFGFKTKLQRENMVMRWSRKRRDRVDELLAREAQAEEDEWTKFHHDELAVKNELTLAILDTIILETSNVVKSVYSKKRRIMV